MGLINISGTHIKDMQNAQIQEQTNLAYLSEFGFSSYELATFTVLSKVGTATAREISKLANVPFGRIYDVLYALHDRGIIAVIPSRPILFKALLVEEALNKIVEVHNNKLGEFKSKIKDIAEELAKKSSYNTGTAKDDIEVFFGRTEFYNNAIIRLKETQNPVSIIANNFTYKAFVYACCNFLHNKKQKLRLLVKEVTNENRKHIKDILRLKGEVRLYDSNSIRMLVEDGQLVSLTVPTPDDAEDRITVIIKNPLFAAAMENFFTMAWKQAKVVKI